MAQVKRPEGAAAALLAPTVARLPPFPVLSACSRSAASAPAHLADDDVIGTVPRGVPHQIPDRHVAAG